MAMPKLHRSTLVMRDAIAVRFCRNRSGAWQRRSKANGRWVRSQ
jgi:hypothetical protein